MNGENDASSFDEPEQDHADETPQIFSARKQPDGSYSLTRRAWLGVISTAVASVVASTVSATAGQLAPGPAGSMAPAPLPAARIPLHAEPSITSNIADTLQDNSFVQYLRASADGLWAEVIGESGVQGWVELQHVDFEHAVVAQDLAERNRLLQDNPSLRKLVSNSRAQVPAAQEPSATPTPYYMYMPVIKKEPTPTPTRIPCSCNTAPCSCNTRPSGCTTYSCVCNVTPCSCDYACVCDIGAPDCGCHNWFCTCDTRPCGCNTFPCSCDAYTCGCVTYYPCSCDFFR